MRLIIAEKPAVATAIAEALGGGRRAQGYFEVGSDRVTWCIGHLLRLLEPQEYEERLGKWTMEDLPIVHIPWRRAPAGDSGAQAQLRVILALLKEATEVVHAGDPDDEGQLIVDSILEYAKCKLPVRRLLVNDNNKKVVQKALETMEDNGRHYMAGRRAEARTVGDQLYGINMTRANTLAARKVGYDAVLHTGRVQTAILGLVVRRDRAHEAHEKANYHQVKGDFALAGMEIPASYKIQKDDPVGDNKELIDEAFAQGIAESVRGQPAVVVSVKTEIKDKQPPLPYNLLKLQAEASGKFKISPKDVMAITQSLKDTHRLITYNRSDCQYLSEEQHDAAPAVLAAVGQTAPMFSGATKAANPAIKSRAFDSSKVSAHHGIVPTETVGNFAQLSDPEQKIYLLIARAYIAQFFPPQQLKQTGVLIECAGHTFKTSSRQVLQAGWQALYRNDADNEETKLEEVECESDLAGLVDGTEGRCIKSRVETKQTQPPRRYTVKTLLLDLPRAAKYIRDPALRALLVERDKDKEGESGGIGTPATRDSHLDGLFSRGYFQSSGDYVVSTTAARDFYDLLPDQAKWPDMSAIWEGKFQQIEAGDLSPVSFVQQLVSDIKTEIERLKVEGLNLKVEIVPCPKCQQPLRRISKSANGPFWSCSASDQGCKTTYGDQNGKPVLVKPEAQQYPCPECAKPLRRIKGGDGHFWGCTGHPACSVTLPDANGKPGQRKAPATLSSFTCQKCSKPLVHREKKGKGGFDFWGCSGFKEGCKTSYPNKNGEPDYKLAK